MENKKYEFTGETKTFCGVTLRRIRALVTIIGVVNSGDCGGWIESENNLQVYGNAWVSGNAWVESQTAICMFSGFGSEYRTTTAFLDKDLGVRIVCGCFTGSLYQFRERVMKTHGEDSKHGKLYLGMANMIEYRLLDVLPVEP